MFSKALVAFNTYSHSLLCLFSLCIISFSNYFLIFSFSYSNLLCYFWSASSSYDFSSRCWRCSCFTSFYFWSNSSLTLCFNSITELQTVINSEWYFLCTSCLTQSRSLASSWSFVCCSCLYSLLKVVMISVNWELSNLSYSIYSHSWFLSSSSYYEVKLSICYLS